jgi:succinate-acetate transporter protein
MSKTFSEAPSGAPVAQPVVTAIADPGPLGLAAFALTTFVLSTFNAGLIDVKAEPVVFGLALFYGGIVQVFAGLWEFVKANTFGALAFCSYGAFWMALWYLNIHDAAGMVAKGAPVGKGVGLFLLGWTIFTAYMTIAATRTSSALLGVFVILLLTFIALTVGWFQAIESMTHLGGWLGLITAAGAW